MRLARRLDLPPLDENINDPTILRDKIYAELRNVAD
jgi:hypothetical protein